MGLFHVCLVPPLRRLNLWVKCPLLKGLVICAFLRDTPGDTRRRLLGCVRSAFRWLKKPSRFVAPPPANGIVIVIKPPQAQRYGHHRHSFDGSVQKWPDYLAPHFCSNRHTFAAIAPAPFGSSPTQRRSCLFSALAPPRIRVVVIHGVNFASHRSRQKVVARKS